MLVSCSGTLGAQEGNWGGRHVKVLLSGSFAYVTSQGILVRAGRCLMPRAGAPGLHVLFHGYGALFFFKDGETHLEMFTFLAARVRLPGSFMVHPLRLKEVSFVIQNLIRPGFVQRL